MRKRNILLALTVLISMCASACEITINPNGNSRKRSSSQSSEITSTSEQSSTSEKSKEESSDSGSVSSSDSSSSFISSSSNSSSSSSSSSSVQSSSSKSSSSSSSSSAQSSSSKSSSSSSVQSSSSQSSSSSSKSSSSSTYSSSSSTPSSSSSTPSSSSSSQSTSHVPVEQDELYYEVEFGNSGKNDSGGKWGKGVTYSWTFTNCEAQHNACFAIGAKMTSSTHADRTLFTNHVDASSSDAFESNAANDGTPRITVKMNGTTLDLFTYTYGDSGLNTTSFEPFKVAGMFDLPEGNVTFTLTTNASVGYRLYLGEFARVYYPESSGPVQEGFSEISEFSSNVEIHTAAQKTYLAYDGDYSLMDPNSYPSGSSHQSDSNLIPVSWKYGVPEGKTLSNFSIIYGQNADLSDGYELVGTTKKSINIINPYLGRNYYQLVANFTDDTKDQTEIKYFDVDSTCPRNLRIEGMTNCRDIGGRLLEDGGRIKQGLIYRTSGKNQNGSITNETRREMLDHLKMKTEINVADSTSYNLSITEKATLNLYMDYGQGNPVPSSHHFSRNAENVKNFFNTVADANNYPIFFHCRIGTDRTGLCAILLSGLLGVNINEIYQDYLFSNFGKIGEKRYIGEKAGQDNIQNYMNEINQMPGKTFKHKVYNMLLAIGVEATTLNQIIDNLTEGTPAQGNNNGQIVATADQLTLGGGATLVNDDSQRDHPDHYVTLNNNNSVSYTFTPTKTGRVLVVAYLGNKEHSSSLMISNAISCSLDENNVTVNGTSYADAGMGNCNSGSRMNYYPVILGEVDLTSGTHTIQLQGITTIASEVLNLGTLCLFPLQYN